MNFGSKRGFVLLDALLGMTLFIAVALLCGYSRQFVHSFTATTATMRQLALRYYRPVDARASELVTMEFEFSHNGVCIASCNEDLCVIYDKASGYNSFLVSTEKRRHF